MLMGERGYVAIVRVCKDVMLMGERGYVAIVRVREDVTLQGKGVTWL